MLETELIKIFDDKRNQIGVTTREEVHKKGFWHETFQCWFISTEKETNYIYLQLRSHLKEAHPNLFDITVAGHLLANESIEDGVREIKEEIGVDIPFNDLAPLGIIESVISNRDSIDRELANVYLFNGEISFDDFTLQEEEVAGMVKIELNEFAELWSSERDTVKVSGFQIKTDGTKILIEEEVGRERFVPHTITYYETVIRKIKDMIR